MKLELSCKRIVKKFEEQTGLQVQAGIFDWRVWPRPGGLPDIDLVLTL